VETCGISAFAALVAGMAVLRKGRILVQFSVAVFTSVRTLQGICGVA
jgi:hypothetical protein